MAYSPIVIEKGLNAGVAKAMAEFFADRKKSEGLMGAALTIQSTSAYEKLGWLGAMPAVSQWIGELKVQEFEDYEYTVKNLDWGVGVPIHQNDLDDDQTQVLQTVPQLLVKRIMGHQEKLIVDLLIGGETATAYDGIAFFSDVSSPRTFDNKLVGTGITLAALTTDLTAARVAMAKFPDDKGELLNIRGNLVVCPVALEDLFRQIVNSQYNPAASIPGVYNPYSDLQVIGDARLDADDANDWYLLATNEVVKPFVFSMRQTAKPGMEKVPLTKTWNYTVDYRGNAKYGLPHLAIKTSNS